MSLGCLLRIRGLNCSLKALSLWVGRVDLELHSSDLKALYFRKALIPFLFLFFFLVFFLGWSHCLEGNLLSPSVAVNWGNRARERGLVTKCPQLWCRSQTHTWASPSPAWKASLWGAALVPSCRWGGVAAEQWCGAGRERRTWTSSQTASTQPCGGGFASSQRSVSQISGTATSWVFCMENFIGFYILAFLAWNSTFYDVLSCFLAFSVFFSFSFWILFLLDWSSI